MIGSGDRTNDKQFEPLQHVRLKVERN